MKQKTVLFVTVFSVCALVGAALVFKKQESITDTKSLVSEVLTIQGELESRIKKESPQGTQEDSKKNVSIESLQQRRLDKMDLLAKNYKSFCQKQDSLKEKLQRVHSLRDRLIEGLHVANPSPEVLAEFSEIEFTASSLEMINALCAADAVAKI